MLEPRKYQIEAVEAVIEASKRGVSRQLISLPTGTGKTIIFALLAKRLGVRTLILAHREELLQQARQKMLLVWGTKSPSCQPEANVGLLRRKETKGLLSEVCIASVQTAIQPKRLAALKSRSFGLLIIDEAHHATADSYYKIASELGFLTGDRGRSPLLVGVTATAYRGDKVALGNVFDEIVFERSTITMIRGGFLCDARGVSVETRVDLADIHTQAGDFVSSELARAVNIPERNALVAGTYAEQAQGRKAVVFCVNVQHSLDMATTFRERGINAEAVYGAMGMTERKSILDAYGRGSLNVVTNCNVLTEGWDAPETSAIFLARPTKSPVLYTQMIGRGLRIHPGKNDCLVVDFADIAGRHSLCGLSTLAGNPRVKVGKGELLTEAIERLEREDWEEDKQKIIVSAENREIDLFERSKYIWQAVGNNFRLPLTDGSSVWCKQTQEGYTAWAVDSSGTIKVLSEDVLPLGYAMGICEDFIRSLSVGRYSDKNAHWRKRPASSGQLEYLKKLGVMLDREITKGEASDLIDKVMSQPASEKQICCIKKHNLHTEPNLLTKTEASRLIAKYKHNNRMGEATA